ncbi:MAG: AbrB/MazE/SpoVT family DNA-binding domain-containing protein [Defluviitaleaceae bacterium]|nr:AbrB/MazE/SpoVT family DNA-binding domain-containing protein [Defluviitaleaceae bacterium]
MTLDYTRKIDDLGRIVIPDNLRQNLGWQIGDTLSLYCIDGAIALCMVKVNRKQECVYCKNTAVKVRINEKDVCVTCLEKIMEMMP